MTLRFALAALLVAGSAQAQGFEFNQADVSLEHSRLYVNGIEADFHHYGARADLSVAEGFGVQVDLANENRNASETLWSGGLHGYARNGNTKYGLFIGNNLQDGDLGNMFYGGEVMLNFGEKWDVEGRLMRREFGGLAAYEASAKAWYDITPQLTLNGRLGFASVSIPPTTLQRYSVAMGIEYELKQAPISLFAGVEHSIYDGPTPYSAVTEASVGMTFRFGKPEKRNTDRMFSDLRRTALF